MCGCPDGPSVPDLDEVIGPLRQLSDQIRRGTEDQQVRLKDAYGRVVDSAGRLEGDLNTAAEGLYGFGENQMQRHEEVGIPLEDRFIERATNYDSEANVNREIAQDVATVDLALQAERDAVARRLEGFGVDISDTRFGNAMLAQGTRNAIAKAGAANTARRTVEDRAIGLEQAAINIMGEGADRGRSYAQTAGQLQVAGQGAVSDAAALSGQLFGTVPQMQQLEANTREQLGGIEMARYGAKLDKRAQKTAFTGDLIGAASQLGGAGMGAM